MKKQIVVRLAGGCSILVVAGAASAGPVKWTFSSDASFQAFDPYPGGVIGWWGEAQSISGYFVVDADLQGVSPLVDWNIQVGGGEFHYNWSNETWTLASNSQRIMPSDTTSHRIDMDVFPSSADYTQLTLEAAPPPDQSVFAWEFMLRFSGPLTDQGGTLDILGGGGNAELGPAVWNGSGYGYDGNLYQSAAGSITGVPSVPKLSISRQAGNQIIVSWSTVYNGATLLYSTNFLNPVPVLPTATNLATGNIEYTFTPTNNVGFFRLVP